jgi:hypothetical protein
VCLALRLFVGLFLFPLSAIPLFLVTIIIGTVSNKVTNLTRDGNGAPFPDPRRGIHPLGDGDGEKILPAGKETGKNQSPSGMARSGTDNGHPYPLPVGDPI